MTTQPKIKLKYAVQLRKERVEGLEDTKPYIGLEHIESSTGRLTISTLDNGETPEEMVLGGESLCNLFEPGDVLFGKLRPYLAKTWVANFSGRCTTELLVMQPLQADASYLKYNFLANEFLEAVTAASYGSKMPRADWDFIGNREILNPPLPTQRRIAAYLDRETAHIDTLIAAKERLLLLMAEKRQALIARAVTRGLDERVKLKDSGVPWLGEVPEGWEVERTKWLFKERNQRSEAGEEELLTVSHITGVTSRSEKNVYMFEAETTEGYKVAYPNDLVINTLWAWMGAMGISPLHGLVSPAYHVYILSERLDPGYVDAIVRTPFFVAEVTRFSKGVWSSRLRLYPEGLYEVYFPVPPLEEQRSIVAFIKKETSKLDQLRITSERSIILLKERRSALIAAAVTGQLTIN